MRRFTKLLSLLLALAMLLSLSAFASGEASGDASAETSEAASGEASGSSSGGGIDLGGMLALSQYVFVASQGEVKDGSVSAACYGVYTAGGEGEAAFVPCPSTASSPSTPTAP